MKLMAVRRVQIAQSGKSDVPLPPAPPPHPGYAPNAALHAIKRHAVEFVSPKELAVRDILGSSDLELNCFYFADERREGRSSDQVHQADSLAHLEKPSHLLISGQIVSWKLNNLRSQF